MENEIKPKSYKASAPKVKRRVPILPRYKYTGSSPLVRIFGDDVEFHPNNGGGVYYAVPVKEVATPLRVAMMAQTLAGCPWASKEMIAKFISAALFSLQQTPPAVPRFDLARVLR